VSPANPPAASPAPASSSNKTWGWFGQKKTEPTSNASGAQQAVQPAQYQQPGSTGQAPATVVHQDDACTPSGHSSSNKGWVWFGLRKNNNNCDTCCEKAVPAQTTNVTEVKPVPQPAGTAAQPTASTAATPCECDDKCDKRWKIFENPFKPNQPATPLHDQKDNCTPAAATP
jgi:hypothetical protein